MEVSNKNLLINIFDSMMHSQWVLIMPFVYPLLDLGANYINFDVVSPLFLEKKIYFKKNKTSLLS